MSQNRESWRQWIRFIRQIWDCTSHNINLRVQFFGYALESQHISQKCCEFAIQLHAVLSYDPKHAFEHVQTLNILQILSFNNFKHILQIFQVLRKLIRSQRLSSVCGNSIDHLGAFFRIGLDYFRKDIQKILSFFFLQLYHHPHIYQSDLNAGPFTHQLQSKGQFIFSMLRGQKFKVWRIQEKFDHTRPSETLENSVIISEFSPNCVIFVDFYHNVSPMAVHMYEVMLEQHLKESTCSNSSNIVPNLFIIVLLEFSHGLSWHKCHNQYFLVGLVKWLWERDFWIRENEVEFLQIPCLLREVQLFKQLLPEGVLINRDLKEQGKQGQEFADCKHDCDVFFNILFNMGVPNFNCHFLSSKSCFIDLTYRT